MPKDQWRQATNRVRYGEVRHSAPPKKTRDEDQIKHTTVDPIDKRRRKTRKRQAKLLKQARGMTAQLSIPPKSAKAATLLGLSLLQQGHSYEDVCQAVQQAVTNRMNKMEAHPKSME